MAPCSRRKEAIMSDYAFELQTRTGRLAADLEAITNEADRAVRTAAKELLRERRYLPPYGGQAALRVSAEWKGDAAIRLRVDGATRESEARSIADFYAHELFLLVNLAVPGALGVASPQLDAYVFEVAWVAAARNGWPAIAPLPLARVVAWYDGLQLGTAQLATTPVARALFALLRLARLDPSEPAALLLLGHALSALRVDEPRLAHFFALRTAAVDGSAAATHPMQDESLDGRIEDLDRETIEAADLASSVLVAAVQAEIGGG
jgi:hypothetical protein